MAKDLLLEIDERNNTKKKAKKLTGRGSLRVSRKKTKKNQNKKKYMKERKRKREESSYSGLSSVSRAHGHPSRVGESALFGDRGRGARGPLLAV